MVDVVNELKQYKELLDQGVINSEEFEKKKTELLMYGKPKPIEPLLPGEKRINKHIFIWVCNFMFGYLGVDRFVRGQIGLGIFKILTLGGIGIWALVDFIIALVKLYGHNPDSMEDVVFIDGKYTI